MTADKITYVIYKQDDDNNEQEVATFDDYPTAITFADDMNRKDAETVFRYNIVRRVETPS